MKKLITFVCFLLLTWTSASPTNDNQNVIQDDLGNRSYVNVTISQFKKIIRTSDISVRDAIYTTPAVVLVGTSDSVLRCLYEDPTECEVFYKTDSRVHSLVVSEDFVFAGLKSGVVLKCTLNEMESCKNFETRISGTLAESLASADGYLYAGLGNGTILRCDLKESNSCRTLHRLSSTVFSVIQHNDSIYAGLWNGQLMSCSLNTENNCRLMYNMSAGIMGFSEVKHSIFAVTWDGNMWNCSQKSDAPDYCVSKPLNYKWPRDISYFKGVIYTLENEKGIYVCKHDNHTDCPNYGNIKHSASMAFAYGTFELQNRYKKEDRACSWQSESKCPPFVTYYDAQQRSHLEVHVKDGRLHNSLGILVDTSNGDEGSSGQAAIFIMKPDGTLLISNSHKTELLHTSSLFAGKPVSGAGEIVVRNGVIKRITTCSQHYRPDLNLNRQVVQSLESQGYEGGIDSRLCDDVDNVQYESSSVVVT